MVQIYVCRTRQKVPDAVTTAQEPIGEARPGDNDGFYIDQEGDDNLTDSKGERQQPPTHASAASKTTSAKRQRNDGDGSP